MDQGFFDKQKRVLWQALVLAVVMFSSLGCYLTVLYWRGPAAQVVTWLPWDELIPFQPQWVWVYLLPYLVAPIIVGLLPRETFHQFLRQSLTVVGLTLAIFILVPTQTGPRPPSQLYPGLTAWMYESMVSIDEPPGNAAPSLHVSLTCLLALALWGDFPRWRLLSLLGCGLVLAATLFTRQHHLLDVATGLLMCLLVVLGWQRWRRGPTS